MTLRIHLPLHIVSGASFLKTDRIAAWGAWVPNLMIAEVVLRWEQRHDSARSADDA
jgi:hypothetical protein